MELHDIDPDRIGEAFITHSVWSHLRPKAQRAAQACRCICVENAWLDGPIAGQCGQIEGPSVDRREVNDLAQMIIDRGEFLEPLTIAIKRLIIYSFAIAILLLVFSS
jgi:hypothetical protein